MRLINSRTLELSLFIGDVPEYAILSHRWEHEEITFEDLASDPISNTSSATRKKWGFKKVQGTCALAARDGFNWVWIDSCCICKSSSSELQEAINSMFAWYEKAQVCYAYLSDVQDTDLRQSKWFTRGWTLQELLAPLSVEFYAADWTPIGSRLSRYEEIAKITGITPEALFYSWSKVSRNFVAAQKMSWAAHRHVSRAEDEAYSLLGLFDVNIPMLYGEGRDKAFYRLQEAIYQLDADHSLFLFRYTTSPLGAPLFAESATQFCQILDCRTCVQYPQCFPVQVPYSDLKLTHYQHSNTDSLAHKPNDYHFVRFARLRSIVSLPLIRYIDVEGDILSLHGSSRFHEQDLLAVLNIACDNHWGCVVAIPLQRYLSSDYVRPVHYPVLLPQYKITGLNSESVLVTVSTDYPEPDSGADMVMIEFKSSTLQLQSWDGRQAGSLRTSSDLKKWVPTRHWNVDTYFFSLHVLRRESPRCFVDCWFKSSKIPMVDSQRLQVLNSPTMYRVDVGKQTVWHSPTSTSESSCWDRLILHQPDKHILHIAFRQLACPDQGNRVGKIVARYRVEMELAKEPRTRLVPID